MIYNLLIVLLSLLFAPKIFWEKWTKNKKFPTFQERLGYDIPDPQGRPVIWIHAVSVGEVKSAQLLLKKIRQERPDAFLLVTTASVTGQEEAKSSLKEADAYRFLPLDFSWIMRKWAQTLRPELLLLVETDLWFNLLKSVREVGGKTALVSGKLSDRSAKRFRLFPFFAKRLFREIDILLVQNEEYRANFASLDDNPSRIQVTGNLKFDATPAPVDRSQWQPLLGDLGFSIALISTHAPEEEELLDALQSIDATLFLAPRHPERFEEVAALLAKRQIPFIRWSQLEQKRGGERVILVDAMGKIPIVCSFSHLSIVAGSFASRIGGHNVLEPCLYGTPVFFGPHMHQQHELAARLLQARAGLQLSAPQLAQEIQAYALNPAPMQQAAHQLTQEVRGVTLKTWEALESGLKWPRQPSQPQS